MTFKIIRVRECSILAVLKATSQIASVSLQSDILNYTFCSLLSALVLKVDDIKTLLYSLTN